ncbi:patatin-like phospholipase family protein [Aliishimia ponticola]|uniref:Patatin-like phospholipase family protein n=1 Tax=Aliishimia ponticola TaxID=2499833 RepID=A0A4S4NIZ9_9RHOB|nr:patatin-like phospholipase family protein [Aliishimia ponticola]THH38717.1 patatin-like phospholipase family protein [Aliishimia ponticola]
MGKIRRINLALQGGGAHGAFTWGVLDRLLEDDEIEIVGISGTSAGAVNGAALKAGLVTGGREGARENLDWLWNKIAGVTSDQISAWMWPFSPMAISRSIEFSLPYALSDTVSRVLSPYAWGPFYKNPLEDVVSQFDFDNVCSKSGPAFYVCATRVRNGKIRIFKGDEITTDAIMASACLPTVFQSVEIDDSETGRREAFWDGGYTGNPALFPLFPSELPEDIVVVNINPLERDEIPITPQQIQNRVNEISFNSSLLRELRAISFVQRLIEEGTIDTGRMARVFIHMIADDDLMNDLSVATKLVPNAQIIHQLKDAGRAAAHRFLDDHKADLNHRSTVDMQDMFG